MSLLDVSDAFDSDFLDEFDVLRRAETITEQGRSTTLVKRFPEVLGVVTSASPDDLARFPDVDVSSKSLSIVTEFRLQLESPGKKADYVIWAGDNFIVKAMNDYTRYGPGFVEVIATSVDKLDLPPGWDQPPDCC